MGRDSGLHRCLFPNPKNQQDLQAAGICRWSRDGDVLGAGNGKTLLLGFSGPVAVLMGMITGISGGMLRDILTARMLLLFGREFYTTPVIFGCTFLSCLTAGFGSVSTFNLLLLLYFNFHDSCNPLGIVLSRMADLSGK
ncbi:MAG: TRIC cation channel family protein [Desulfoprunum sp.]|nr:TRIC cation channel family protein [Desulfoprunum sp.]